MRQYYFLCYKLLWGRVLDMDSPGISCEDKFFRKIKGYYFQQYCNALHSLAKKNRIPIESINLLKVVDILYHTRLYQATVLRSISQT